LSLATSLGAAVAPTTKRKTLHLIVSKSHTIAATRSNCQNAMGAVQSRKRTRAESVDERAARLLQLVGEAKGSPLKHTAPPTRPRNISAAWILHDRQGAKREVLAAARNNLERFDERCLEKRLWDAVIVTGAAGSGKTRLCHESFQWIRDAGLDVSNVMDVFITFLNGEQLTSADARWQGDEDFARQGSVALGIRVACKLFAALGLCDSMTLRSFRASLGESSVQELCDLRTVMRACSLHLKATDKENPIWVTLVLDETHFAEHPEEDGAPQFWPSIMGSMMQYIIPAHEYGFCLEDNIVLFPIIASTWSTERQKHHWSPGNKIFPSLPALSMASVGAIFQQVAAQHPNIRNLWNDQRLRHFFLSCGLIPYGLSLALETAIEWCEGDTREPQQLRGELTKQICLKFARRFKPGEQLRQELAEIAFSGVAIPSVEAFVDGHPLSHWLACGFASSAEGAPVSIPFPALFNEGGRLMPGISQFTNFGQPFYWQDFEALVPQIIRLRCESLRHMKLDRQASLADVFGSGPSIIVDLCMGMAVVTCVNQWLVPKRGKAETLRQQLKVKNPQDLVNVGINGNLPFGSERYVFAAANGNVHFDGHLSFKTVQNETVLVCYQVKHTHIDPSKTLQYYTWDQVNEWLEKARSYMSGYASDLKLYVMVTNKEVRGLVEPLPVDLILVHQDTLHTFFAPCLLASASLATEKEEEA